jgi:hypothetical protein
MVAKQNIDQICSVNAVKIYSSEVEDILAGYDKFICVRHLGQPEEPKMLFSDNLVYGAYGGYTVVFLQMQIAYYMGFREVILIGIDFDFDTKHTTGSKEYSRSGVLISGGGLNHFHRDYRLPGEMWTVPQLDKQKAAFKCAQKLFEANGRIIVNASRKTKLNVFRQVNLNTVLNSNVGEL